MRSQVLKTIMLFLSCFSFCGFHHFNEKTEVNSDKTSHEQHDENTNVTPTHIIQE